MVEVGNELHVSMIYSAEIRGNNGRCVTSMLNMMIPSTVLSDHQYKVNEFNYAELFV